MAINGTGGSSSTRWVIHLCHQFLATVSRQIVGSELVLTKEG